MVTSTTPPASVAPARDRAGADAAPPARQLGRRPSLPAGRAIVGGLLVTVAAIGTFAAYANATAGPARSYVVAASAVRAGQRLTTADLRIVPLDLPDGVEQRAFSSTADLEGATALAPIDENQLIAPAAVRTASQAGPQAVTHEVSFALERDKALAGRLQRGERIDLVATYGSGSDATSRLVVRRAQVVDVDSGGRGTVGSSSKVTVTVALDSDHQVLEALHAIEIAKVTLVRTTGEAPDDSSTEPYRPDTAAGPGTPVAGGTGAGGGRNGSPPSTAGAGGGSAGGAAGAATAGAAGTEGSAP